MDVEAKIIQIEEDFNQFKATTRDDIKDLYKISNGYVDRQARMEVKVETVSGDIKAVAGDVRRLDDKIDKKFSDLVAEIKALSAVPGQRWNTVVTVLITAICSSGISVIITTLLK